MNDSSKRFLYLLLLGDGHRRQGVAAFLRRQMVDKMLRVKPLPKTYVMVSSVIYITDAEHEVCSNSDDHQYRDKSLRMTYTALKDSTKAGAVFKDLVEADKNREIKPKLDRLDDWPRKMYNRVRENEDLMATLESLLPWQDQWDDFKFGMLDRVMSMRFDEEVCHYLHRTNRLWKDVMGKNSPEKLDKKTYEYLKLMMPAYSTADAEAIRKAMGTGALFPGIKDSTQRDNMTSRLLKCERFISVESFSNDTKYLRACFEALRHLLPRTDTPLSVRETLKGLYSDDAKSFPEAYLCLCLYAMRHFDSLSDTKFSKALLTKRKGSNHANKTPQTVASAQSQLTKFAISKGFRLDHLPKPEGELPIELVPQDDLRTSWESPELPKEQRQNRPHLEDQSVQYLYLENLIKPPTEPPKKFVTPYAVRRHIAWCFFGSLLDVELQNDIVDYYSSTDGPTQDRTANLWNPFLNRYYVDRPVASSIYSRSAEDVSSSTGLPNASHLVRHEATLRMLEGQGRDEQGRDDPGRDDPGRDEPGRDGPGRDKEHKKATRFNLEAPKQDRGRSMTRSGSRIPRSRYPSLRGRKRHTRVNEL